MGLENEKPYDPVAEMLVNDGIVEESDFDNEPEEQEEDVEEFESDEEQESELDYDDDEYDEEDGEEEPDEGREQTIEINGENVPLSELKDGYLRQSDYTRKTQELAQQRTALAALEGLGRVMSSDPQKAAQIAAVIRGEQLQQKQPVNEPPEDPIDRIKWEAKQELMQEFAPQFQQMSQTQAQMQQQALVQQTLAQYQRDPQFNDAYAEMRKMVAEKMVTEGKRAADQYYAQVDSDPVFFGQEFEKAKARLGAKKVVPKKKGSPRLASAKGGVKKQKTGKRKAREAELEALRSGNPDAIFDAVVNNGGFGNLFEG